MNQPLNHPTDNPGPLPLGAGPPWWNTSWSYRKEIVIDHNKVDADLSNFPVLIHNMSSDFVVHAQSDGNDFVFASSDNTIQYNHEIEYYNSSSGELVAWVNVTSLSSNANTTLYIYYGNPGASNQQNPTAVWDSGYVMVQHLHETSGTHYDSTSNNNDGTPHNGLIQNTMGLIDGADEFDGYNDYIDCGSDSSLDITDKITIEAWVNHDGASYQQRVLSKAVWTSYGICIGSNENNNHALLRTSKGTLNSDFQVSTVGWHYIVGTYNASAGGNNAKIYVDGVLYNSTSWTGSLGANTYSVIIGSNPAFDVVWFDGMIDEVKISNVDRDDNWISTAYNNHYTPSLFYTVGDEELYTPPDDPILTEEEPLDGTTSVDLNPVLSIKVVDYQGDLMNVTFRTNASGPWMDIGTNSSGGNDTYSQVSSGMDSYSTTYYWSVNCSDGTYWTNETFSFTTRIQPGIWWNIGWNCRKEIIIDHTMVADALINFPVLINLGTDPDLKSKAQSDGDDIVFTDYNGNKLHHEIEKYEGGTGKLVAWVNVSALSSNSDIVFYMYYGNSSCSSQENAENVWDSNFKMVHHLEETSGNHYDSTGYGNDGSPVNGVLQDVIGMINGGDEFDGSDDYVYCGSHSSLDELNPITFEGWVYLDSYGSLSAGRVFEKSNRLWFTDGFDTSRHCLSFVQHFSGTHGQWLTPTGSLSTSEWYYVALIYDGSSSANDPIVYINGVSQTLNEMNTPSGTCLSDASSNLTLGDRISGGRSFDGKMDEVRVSNVMRSAGWVVTCYNNQHNPSSFYSIGDEEMESIQNQPEIFNEIPSNGATSVGLNPVLSIQIRDYQGDLMNVTFRTNASGPWMDVGTNSSVGNDTYYCDNTSVMGDYNTTYWWSVNATDVGSGNWTNRTFSFTTSPEPPAWWNINWLYRKEITIDNSKVVEDLTNFPVLIKITDDDLKIDAQVDGDDIVFTDYYGTKLNHEIESFNHSLGELVAWVNITNLSSTNDTILYMYYGNPFASSQENVEDVWDDNFVMVHHLEEISGTHYDSTSRNNDGSPEGGVVQDVVGKIDGADNFDGVDDVVNCDNSGSLNDVNPVTFEVWIYPDSYGQLDAGRVFDKDERLIFVDGYDASRHCLDFIQHFSDVNGLWRTPTDSIITDQWYHVAVIYDGSSTTNDPIVYINGVSQTLNEVDTPSGTALSDAENVLLIGKRLNDPGGEYGGYRAFDGIIDEVRISSGVRSAGWVSTEFNNQNNPSAFYTVGIEEIGEIPENPIIFNEFPQNQSTEITIDPMLSIQIRDYQGDLMNVTFRTNASGPWMDIGTNSSGGNDTYSQVSSGMDSYSTTYYWSVNCTDSTYWTNESFHFTTRPSYYFPTIINESPENGSSNVILNPVLSAYVEDKDGDLMNITFSYYNGSTWVVLQFYQDKPSGTYTANTNGYMNYPYTEYEWRVTADDQHGHVTEAVFNFTTGGVLSLKWSTYLPSSSKYGCGMYMADINDDGQTEIVAPSGGRVTVLNGSDGSQIWTHLDGDIDGASSLVIDLTNDGLPEIVQPLWGAGVLALYGNGTVYWRNDNIAGQHSWSHPCAFDIDGDGYPTIYWAGSTECTGDGRICAIAANGTVLHMDQICKCCSGGITVADYNYDGVFEVYMGDRAQSPYGLGCAFLVG